VATFFYKAINSKGKQKKGTLEADSARLLRQELRLMGLTPVEVVAVADKSSKRRVGLLKNKIKTADLALITRQLAT